MDFSVSYTSSQVVLTGTNGTSFEDGGQTLATDTINITGPASLKLQLNQHANVVSITGDGTDSLSSLVLRLGAGKQTNSLTLDSVIADALTIHGERSNDSVTLDQSTVNGNVQANLRHASGDALDLESTTVNGDMTDQVGQLTVNQSTITGSLHDVELGKSRTLTSTDATYGGDTSIRMGVDGVVNLLSSSSGSNEFQSAVTIAGVPHHQTTVNENPGADGL